MIKESKDGLKLSDFFLDIALASIGLNRKSIRAVVSRGFSNVKNDAPEAAPIPNNADTPREPLLLRRNEIAVEPVPYNKRISGIDVSSHQGNIFWNKVVEAGHKFVFIKTSEGGMDSRGYGFVDKNMTGNAAGAASVGLIRGTYHFGTWYNADRKKPEVDARNEAEHYWNSIERAGIYGKGAFPPVLDLEGSTREDDANKYPKEVIVAWAMEFLRRLEELQGPDVWIYTGYWFDRRLGSPKELRKYPLWLARYSKRKDPDMSPKDWPWLFWQYTGSGTCPGIDGKVDVNQFLGSEEDLLALAGIQKRPSA